MSASSTTSSAADRLRLAIEARNRAEAVEARALADFAAEHEWPVDAEIDLVGQRPVRVGADGTPLLDEYVALEVAALKGISVAAATWLIRDVVNLRFRHPRLWTRALCGDLPLYRACHLAAEAARFELTAEQAHLIDDEVAPRIGGLPWRRLLSLYRGLIADQVPGKLEELSARARSERFVRRLGTDDPTVDYLSARVDTADARYFDAMVDQIADLLQAQGDTATKDVRRAKSIGILATPARATLLLAQAAAQYTPHPAGSSEPHTPTTGDTTPEFPDAAPHGAAAEASDELDSHRAAAQASDSVPNPYEAAAAETTDELDPHGAAAGPTNELDPHVAGAEASDNAPNPYEAAAGPTDELDPHGAAAEAPDAATEPSRRRLLLDDQGSHVTPTADELELRLAEADWHDECAQGGNTEGQPATGHNLPPALTPAELEERLAEADAAVAPGAHTTHDASAAFRQAVMTALATIRWTDPRLLPKCRLYLHVAEDTVLHGRGPARAEKIGPIAASMLGLLIGNSRVELTPVVRPYETIAVDAYEVPQRIREQVILRDTVEVFPFSARSARTGQYDHTIPYRPGVPGQTRTDNLGSLATKPHRGKTHGHWRLKQPKSGIFWWTSPAGNQYRVTRGNTMRLHNDTPLDRAVTDTIRRHDETPILEPTAPYSHRPTSPPTNHPAKRPTGIRPPAGRPSGPRRPVGRPSGPRRPVGRATGLRRPARRAGRRRRPTAALRP